MLEGMPDPTLQELRDRLLELHAQARALGYHEVAYHALAAAMHAGESSRDLASIDLVEQRSREHGQWLDSHDPQHPLSSPSAAQRGHHSLFQQLAATCAAVRARIKAELLTGKQKGRP